MKAKKAKIEKKISWDYGMNTYLENGIWLSSTRMLDGTTLYNVYANGELIEEDTPKGYHKLMNEYGTKTTEQVKELENLERRY